MEERLKEFDAYFMRMALREAEKAAAWQIWAALLTHLVLRWLGEVASGMPHCARNQEMLYYAHPSMGW